jgi:CheY-like chemotaxis protein
MSDVITAGRSILVIDDDAQVRNVVSEMLRLEGHAVDVAENGLRAMEKLGHHRFDLVITDLLMPEQEGFETISEIRRGNRLLPIVAISGGGRLGPRDYLDTARAMGADAALAKPFARQELLTTVNSLLPD